MKNISKKVVAVQPYKFKNDTDYLGEAFNEWVKCGGKWKKHHKKPRLFFHFIYKYSVPFKLPQNKKEARLLFINASTLFFCTFADYVRYEIIPVLWDCWPRTHTRLFKFLRRNKVKVAIVMSKMMGDIIKKALPEINILCLSEGINTSLCQEGPLLKDRQIDLLEFGRSSKRLTPIFNNPSIVHRKSKNGEHIFKTVDEFYKGLTDSKVSIAFPRCDTHPELAGEIETLTQRYWECMLSRVVIIGRAPFELKELLGYNPVLEIDKEKIEETIIDIKNNPEEYQSLVDKNREMAIKYASWECRIREIQNFLIKNGYTI